MSFFAGIDSGTQSTKVLVVDEEGRVLGRGQSSYRLIEGLGIGHKEQHPSTWIGALKEAFAEAVADAEIDPGEIAGVGVSGQQHGFVPLDGKDEVIRPAKLWCDTATAVEAEEIMAANGGLEAYVRMTGNSVAAGFTASKILWLKKHEPENFARLRTILLPHDYLNFWLTGVKRMEPGDASGTALLDVRSRAWCGQAIMSIDPGVGEMLPPLGASEDPVGTVGAQAAAELGLPASCVVSAGGGDNMMGAIGTGNVSAGVVTVSLGTSGTIYAYSATPVVDEARGEIAAFCDSTGGWLPLLCTMNVTVATELVKKTFGMSTEALNTAATAVSPGAGGLMLLPYFEGERVPAVPDGTGVWLGYNDRTHGPASFARAAMEGPTLGLAYGFNRLRDLGIDPQEVRLTGGGSKSPVWRQIVADVFGLPAVCTVEPEGAALGAAIQAMWAHARQADASASIESIVDRVVRLDESTRAFPDVKTNDVYTRYQEIHDALSEALRPVFRMHRAFTEG